jgi:hypothetical protein
MYRSLESLALIMMPTCERPFANENETEECAPVLQQCAEAAGSSLFFVDLTTYTLYAGAFPMSVVLNGGTAVVGRSGPTARSK